VTGERISGGGFRNIHKPATAATMETPQSKSKQELLAFEIARSLGDTRSSELYLSFAQTYPEHLLRAILAEVLSVPLVKIRKSRGALFTFLVRKYGDKNTYNHRA
jgi:hypothetical protein